MSLPRVRAGCATASFRHFLARDIGAATIAAVGRGGFTAVVKTAPSDEEFMRAALNEAQKGLGQTSPNPCVGAVLISGERIVSKGHHRRAGEPHAEVNCLAGLVGPLPPNATLYVTLEPCSTAGRTPPCTDAILQAGVREVVVGTTDPNPRHAGRGIELLQRNGVTVRSGILDKECTSLNEAFNKWIQTRRPFVIAKCGMSLDGRLTAAPDEERWITSSAARRHANRVRAEVDAILIGAETLRADNPHLTVRTVRNARQPWRVVISRSGKLPTAAHLFTDRFADRTLVFRGKDLSEVLAELGEKEVTSVLIEGGGEVLGQALDQRLIDKAHIYLGAVFTGGPVVAFPGGGASTSHDALRLRNVSYERIGDDVFVTGNTAHAPAFSE